MDMHMDMDMGMGAMGMGGDAAKPEASAAPAADSPLSYFAYGKHSGTIMAHIALMVVAWCFVLPAGVVLSIARSRLALPTQLVFLVFNAIGLLVGIVYNTQTLNLYENNAYHKIGWIIIWVASAQVVMTLIFAYAGRGEAEVYERAAFLHVSTYEAVSPLQSYSSGAFHDYRWSRDSGQGMEQNSSLYSRSASPRCDLNSEDDGFEKPEDQVRRKSIGCWRWFQGTVVDRFLSSRVPAIVSGRVIRVLDFIHMFLERIIMPFDFVAITSGGIEIFNGLAHFIKGGIFIWYGLLTLGRWMGCWADLGWAWNVKPTTSYLPARPPTEIIASFCLIRGGLIFMLSTRTIVKAMEFNGLDVFSFTVDMGFTAFIMACAILFIALKAWAVKRESKPQIPPPTSNRYIHTYT